MDGFQQQRVVASVQDYSFSRTERACDRASRMCVNDSSLATMGLPRLVVKPLIGLVFDFFSLVTKTFGSRPPLTLLDDASCLRGDGFSHTLLVSASELAKSSFIVTWWCSLAYKPFCMREEATTTVGNPCIPPPCPAPRPADAPPAPAVFITTFFDMDRKD